MINSHKMLSTILAPAAYLSRNLQALTRMILRSMAAFYRLGGTPKRNRYDVINVILFFIPYKAPTADNRTILS